MTARRAATACRIAYEAHGEGEPLLFVQGLGYDRWGWRPLPGLLATDFRVLVFDNRGVGESDVPPGPYTARRWPPTRSPCSTRPGSSARTCSARASAASSRRSSRSRIRSGCDKLVLVSTAPGMPNMHPMPGADARS